MSQRILISAKGISEFFKNNAIVFGTEFFEITGEELRFIKNNGIIFSYPIVHCQRSNGGEWKGFFDPVQWARIINFLDSIPEQPVVIEVVHYGNTNIHSDVEINISEFTMKF